MMIDQAIDKLELNIQAQIKALGSGRGVAANAQSFNDLILAKNTLMSMKSKKKATNLTCEHCGTTDLTKNNYGRWHSDNCKDKK
jgi:hypothetical protein